MDKNIAKNQSSTNALNCVKNAIQKTATGNSIGNKIADKTTTVSITSPQDSLEKIRNEKEIPK